MTGFYSRRVRGFRVLDVAGLCVVLGLAGFVYFAKTTAGREGSQIDQTEAQIVQERRQVRILQAEIAHLEQPSRLERLSSQYLGLQPLKGEHEVGRDQLAEIALKADKP